VHAEDRRATHVRECTPASAAVAAALLFIATCGGDDGTAVQGDPSRGALPQGNDPVELDPAEFTVEIDNRYWRMEPGTRWTYREIDADGTEPLVVACEAVARRSSRSLGRTRHHAYCHRGRDHPGRLHVGYGSRSPST